MCSLCAKNASCKQAGICYNSSIMANEPLTIDVSNYADLLRLAEEVAATHKPRLLKRDNMPIALLTPIQEKPSHQAKRKAIEETLALAGAWSDLDWEDMREALDHIRHDSKPTPPFALDL
jgi:hypothetical protein